MERYFLLRLIAEGKTKEALTCIINKKALVNISNNINLSDADMQIIFLSNRLHMLENAFMNDLIKFEEYSSAMNKITLQLLELLNAVK